jgi:pimeloyl-ACP methyl ester carboxylesterase
MPEEGESAIELGSRHPGELAALVDTDEAGDLVLRGDQLDEILWPDAPAETAAMARAMLRPQAMQSFREAPPRVAWRQTPSTYVVGRNDRAFHRQLVDEMASRAATVIEWDTSHSPLLSRPDLVADLLARIDAC